MRCPSPDCPDVAIYGVPGSYADGLTVCPKCGSALAPDEESAAAGPVEMEAEPVKVGGFLQRQDADLAQSLLAANGIDSFVTADDSGNVYAGCAPGQIHLLVAADDEERARELLTAAETGELV